MDHYPGWDPPLLTSRSDHCAEEGAESEEAGGLFTAGGEGGLRRRHPEDKWQLSGWSSSFLGHSLIWLSLLTLKSFVQAASFIKYSF